MSAPTARYRVGIFKDFKDATEQLNRILFHIQNDMGKALTPALPFDASALLARIGTIENAIGLGPGGTGVTIPVQPVVPPEEPVPPPDIQPTTDTTTQAKLDELIVWLRALTYLISKQQNLDVNEALKAGFELEKIE